MMEPASPWCVVLASQEEMHRVWGRFDHGPPASASHHWMIIVGISAVFVLAVLVWRASKKRSTRVYTSDSSAKLFSELCAAHGLPRANRKLLKRLADARGVTNPAMLFLEPHQFGTNGLPAELKASAPELGRIHGQLFE